METNQSKKVVPLKKGLFEISESGEVAHLIGSKCKTCNDTFFPKRYSCLSCGGRELDTVALSKKGRVWTYTIARQTPAVSLIKAPYAIAYVELPEGAIVLTVMEDCELDKVKIGMEVQLTTKKVSEDPEGNDVIAFEFKPVEG